jgi:TfoX/Sxy family transcriptional regulator of competence genes
MTENEDLLVRLRALFAGIDDAAEKPMVGGRSFSVGGRMVCGVTSSGLMVRIDPTRRPAVLAEPHVRPMTLGAKQPRSFVIVAPGAVRTRQRLQSWVDRGISAAQTRAPERE